MSFWALAALINALTATGFGLFVYINNKRNPTNIAWGLFSATIAFWSYSYFFWQISNQESLALFWCKVLTMGSIFIPAVFLHFILIWLDMYNSRKKLLVFCYSISIIAFILNFTPLIVEKVEPILFFKYWPKAGPAYLPFLIFWWGVVIYCWYIMYKSMQVSSPTKRNQIFYVFIAAIIGFSGGFTNYLLWYDIKFPPYGNILVSVYVGLMAYAIVRHQLMDIEVIIKKTLVFASLFLIAFGIFVGITVITQELIAGGRLLGLAISSVIIIFAVRPLEDFLVKTTDKYLFQKKYDYTHLIRQFMDELKTMVLNVQDIAQSTLDFLASSIRPNASVIFMQNKFTNKYDVIATANFKDKNLKISDDTTFINELKNKGKIINLTNDKILPEEEKEQFRENGIELAIPLIIHKELLGILFLGKKKSDKAYAEEDLNVLANLSGTLSIAINNAQLFDERADAEKRAMIGTLATGINHEIGNPLNIISIRLQSFRIFAKQGLLTKKTKEEIIDEVNDIAKTCLESAERISDITKKISEFAKPDKKLMLDKVDVDEVIDDTISVLEHELVLEHIKFKKNINCKNPHIMVDRGQSKQILFNLIKNAAQSINNANKTNGEITIDVAKYSPGEISIKVIDNGPGIPQKDIEKIFMPFYTTKEPGKGTGLGLSLVSRLVERNNARIEVKSKEGEGTTFTMIFKGNLYE